MKNVIKAFFGPVFLVLCFFTFVVGALWPTLLGGYMKWPGITIWILQVGWMVFAVGCIGAVETYRYDKFKADEDLRMSKFKPKA